jgi:uncharacterized membrane protein
VSADSRARLTGRAIIGLFYLVAGVLHLASPAPFLRITPDWVPYPGAIVALTGAAEVAGAIGLWTVRWRRAAATGLALYALCVWPANFNHMLIDLARPGDETNMLYHWVRLPLQIPLIWWTLWSGRVISWPWRAVP